VSFTLCDFSHLTHESPKYHLSQVTTDTFWTKNVVFAFEHDENYCCFGQKQKRLVSNL